MKKFFCLILAVLLVFSLCACEDKDAIDDGKCYGGDGFTAPKKDLSYSSHAEENLPLCIAEILAHI